MLKTTSTNAAPLTRTAHIDWLHVAGPLHHQAIGELFYKAVSDDHTIPVGASAFRPNTKRNPEDIYIRSKEVQDDGWANVLEFNCCPPKILQAHNFFGHANLLDYTYAMFDRQTTKFNIPVSYSQREEWRTGEVQLYCAHLTANFWLPEENIQMALIDGIDQNNRSGKVREYETSITLGFTPKKRSDYHCATVYAKSEVLKKDWRSPGPLQSRILDAARRSIRVEIKVYGQWLKSQGLEFVMRWKDVDVNSLFFKLLAKYDIANAFQPVMTEDECAMLTTAEKRAYSIWLNGGDLKDHYSRTAVWKFETDIEAKTGQDIHGNRRPEALPLVDLREILVPGNIVPVPHWAHLPENAKRYWAPGTALA